LYDPFVICICSGFLERPFGWIPRPAMARQRPKPSLAPEMEDTRSRILRAAEQVFAEKGYTGARVAEIAERSGTDKRLIFYYFGTKQGLYSCTLEEFFEKAQPLLDGFLRSEFDRTRRFDLPRFLERMTEFIQKNRNPVRILFREFLDGGLLLESLLPQRILPIFSLWREYYPRLFQGSSRAGREADHMLLTLSGMSLFYFLVVPLMEQVWDEDPLNPNRLSELKTFLRRWVTSLSP